MKTRDQNRSRSRPNRRSAATRQLGNALLAVIGIVGTLAALGVAYQATVQSQMRTYDALAARIANQNAVDAAVNLGIWRVVGDWRRNPAAIEEISWNCRQNNIEILLTVENESRRLNVNLADERSIAREIERSGAAPGEARMIAGRIADYIDRDQSSSEGLPELEMYAAERRAEPRNRPLEIIEQLRLVPGVDAPMYERLSEILSIHSARSDRLAAGRGGADALDAYPRGVYRITALAPRSDGSPPKAGRTAVIEIDPARPLDPAIRVWSRSVARSGTDAPSSIARGECRQAILSN